MADLLQSVRRLEDDAEPASPIEEVSSLLEKGSPHHGQAPKIHAGLKQCRRPIRFEERLHVMSGWIDRVFVGVQEVECTALRSLSNIVKRPGGEDSGLFDLRKI